MDLNKIVKKLSKEKGNIIYTSDIKSWIEPRFITNPSGLTTATYRCINTLKNREILTPIQNGVYFVGTLSGTIEDLEEDMYWKCVKKSLQHFCGSSYIIVGPKSLELHQKNYESPDILHVYTPNTQKKISLLGSKKILFHSPKTYSGGPLFPALKTFSTHINIEGMRFHVANEELMLLEALTHKNGVPDIDMYVVKRYLKRHHSRLSAQNLHKLVELRYISAINRLREISRDSGYEDLYATCVDVIKKSGKGCFLTMNT